MVRSDLQRAYLQIQRKNEQIRELNRTLQYSVTRDDGESAPVSLSHSDWQILYLILCGIITLRWNVIGEGSENYSLLNRLIQANPLVWNIPNI